MHIQKTHSYVQKEIKLNKSLEQLIKISKFDSQISSFGPKIDAQNEKLALFMAQANKLKAEVVCWWSCDISIQIIIL